MTSAPPTADELNALHAQFWAEENKNFQRRLADSQLLAHAVNQLNYDVVRGLPVAYQQTLEHQLEVAEALKNKAVASDIRDRAVKAAR